MNETWDLAPVMGEQYPQRREELLRAFGLGAELQRSEQVKATTGLYCRERASQYYRERRGQGEGRLRALNGSLDALARFCVTDGPCAASFPEKTESVIQRQKRHLGLVASAYAFIDRIPQGRWEKLMPAVAAAWAPIPLPDCNQLYNCYEKVDYTLLPQGLVGGLLPAGLNCDGRGSAPLDLLAYGTAGLGLSYLLCTPYLRNNPVTSCNSRVVTTTAADGTKTKVTIPVRRLEDADVLIANPLNKGKKEPWSDVRHDLSIAADVGLGMAISVAALYGLAQLGVFRCG